MVDWNALKEEALEAAKKAGEWAAKGEETLCTTGAEYNPLTHWVPVPPETKGAVVIPDAGIMESIEYKAKTNPYASLTPNELNKTLARAFDGKPEAKGKEFSEDQLGALRAIASSQDIKAVAPEKGCMR